MIYKVKIVQASIMFKPIMPKMIIGSVIYKNHIKNNATSIV